MAENKKAVYDINALGQAMDTSFTRSSASSGPVISVHSVKAKFVDENRIRVTYMTVVNMFSDKDQREMCKLYEKESDPIIENAVKKIALDYKEITDQKIKFKRQSIDSTVEIVNLNHFNQNRTAYFRRIAIFEIA
jgi:hypothetical protein